MASTEVLFYEEEKPAGEARQRLNETVTLDNFTLDNDETNTVNVTDRQKTPETEVIANNEPKELEPGVLQSTPLNDFETRAIIDDPQSQTTSETEDDHNNTATSESGSEYDPYNALAYRLDPIAAMAMTVVIEHLHEDPLDKILFSLTPQVGRKANLTYFFLKFTGTKVTLKFLDTFSDRLF
jgi:hypothetical protein